MSAQASGSSQDADEVTDLQGRILRTVEYVDELLAGPLHRDAEQVAKAVRDSLLTPVVTQQSDSGVVQS